MTGVRFYKPKTRLELALAPGGKTREAAIADATVNVETLREPAPSVIEAAIAELENQFTRDAPIEEDKVFAVLDRIVSLCLHFGFDQLGSIAEEFAMLLLSTEEKVCLRGPVASTYVKSMRLLRPQANCLSAADAARIVLELKRVRSHLIEPPRQ